MFIVLLKIGSKKMSGRTTAHVNGDGVSATISRGSLVRVCRGAFKYDFDQASTVADRLKKNLDVS